MRPLFGGMYSSLCTGAACSSTTARLNPRESLRLSAQQLNGSTDQRHLHWGLDSDTIYSRTKSEQTTWPPLLNSKISRPCSANRVSALLCPRWRRNPALRRELALQAWTTYLAEESRADKLRNWPARPLPAVPVWCCRFWRNRRCAAKWRLISTLPIALTLFRERRRALCWSGCCGFAVGTARTSDKESETRLRNQG